MTETLKNSFKAAITLQNFKRFEKIFERALEEEYDFNLKTNYDSIIWKETFANYLAKSCHDKKILALFLNKVNVDINIKNYDEQTIAEACIAFRNFKFLNLLIDKYPAIKIKTSLILETLLTIMWSNKHKKELNDLGLKLIDKVNNKKDLNNLVKKTTLLHCAIMWSNKPIFRKLLTIDEIDLNKRDSEGETPLMLSVHNVEFCKALLKKGVKVNLKNYIYGAALHIAAEWDEVDSLKELIKAGANTTLKNVFEENALISSIQNNISFEIVELLIKTLDVNSVDNLNESILHKLANVKSVNQNFQQKVLDLKNLNLNIQNYLGRTPLHEAIIEKNFFFADCLLERGADTKITDLTGWTPLMYAVNANSLQESRKLIKLEDKETLNNIFGYFTKKPEVEFKTLQILSEYLV